jgi:hypothetical protein
MSKFSREDFSTCVLFNWCAFLIQHFRIEIELVVPFNCVKIDLDAFEEFLAFQLGKQSIIQIRLYIKDSNRSV